MRKRWRVVYPICWRETVTVTYRFRLWALLCCAFWNTDTTYGRAYVEEDGWPTAIALAARR